MFRTGDSGGKKWPLPLTYAQCSSLRLNPCVSIFFFFPAWCTFENINPYPSKLLTRKIKVQLGKTRSKRQRRKQCKTERFSKTDQIFVEFCLRATVCKYRPKSSFCGTSSKFEFRSFLAHR